MRGINVFFKAEDGIRIKNVTGVQTCALPIVSPEGASTQPSTSRATRHLREIAPSARLGPPSSVEPTVRPGPARQVAVKRGREATTRWPNNPETGCWWDEHYCSLIGNGSLVPRGQLVATISQGPPLLLVA